MYVQSKRRSTCSVLKRGQVCAIAEDASDSVIFPPDGRSPGTPPLPEEITRKGKKGHQGRGDKGDFHGQRKKLCKSSAQGIFGIQKSEALHNYLEV